MTIRAQIGNIKFVYNGSDKTVTDFSNNEKTQRSKLKEIILNSKIINEKGALLPFKAVRFGNGWTPIESLNTIPKTQFTSTNVLKYRCSEDYANTILVEHASLHTSTTTPTTYNLKRVMWLLFNGQIFYKDL